MAALTHGNPSGYLPAGVLAGTIYLLLGGLSVREALARIKPHLRTKPGFEETLLALEQAEILAADSGTSPTNAIEKLGEGWVAEEALAVGAYCAMRARTFEEGVVFSVSHGGDSDSTGSIAGNLLGAAMGKSAIPRRWLEKLELRDVIEELANDMFAMTRWDIGEYEGRDNERIYAKYPPN